jgi:hypothetical protein
LFTGVINSQQLPIGAARATILSVYRDEKHGSNACKIPVCTF